MNVDRGGATNGGSGPPSSGFARRVTFPRESTPRASVVIVGWRSAPHLLRCLRSLAANRPVESFEVVVVLNEPSEELVASLERDIDGILLLRSRVNLGYARACNWGVAKARGEYVALLNDDTEVDAGWLDSLIHTIEAGREIGAVGSRLLNPDGSLQEAGSLIWSDGSTSGVRPSNVTHSDRLDWAREIDYCSAASLLVRRTTWEQVGGLEEGYFPAYYEDVDFCLKLKELGLRIWYQPLSVVYHEMSASTSGSWRHYLMMRNRARFVSRWSHVLDRCVPPSHNDPEAVDRAIWLAMGSPTRILVIDDRLPEAAIGAGFPRMVDTLNQLVQAPDHHVTLFLTAGAAGDHTGWSGLGVRVLMGGDLAEQLVALNFRPDVVIISRPHNYERHAALIRRELPSARIVYDAEALYHRRIERQADLVHDEEEGWKLLAEANAMRSLEREIFQDADHIVCISDGEAKAVADLHDRASIDVLSAHLSMPRITSRRFAERSDLIFVAGWLAGCESPNGDGLLWFIRHVLPLVRARVAWARVRVTGANPPGELRRLAGPSVRFEGRVEDLHDFYDRARLAVVPIRFGAGVKLKTIEAMQFGVPIVSTSVGAEGVNSLGTTGLVVTDDPRSFAEAVASLLTNRSVWERQHNELIEWSARGRQRPSGPSWPSIVEAVL